MHNNFLLKTDSYKITHWAQYPEGTQRVMSYFECRKGARFEEFPFFGLQYILKRHFEGIVFGYKDIFDAEAIFKSHFGSDAVFNGAGWRRLLAKHGGKLPLRIRALPEGTIARPGLALFTVENTDEEFPWLTNVAETLLMQTWYPTTVAALSYTAKKVIAEYLRKTGSSDAMLSFMLQDFGFRGASSHESAGIGGAAHLVNFLGTDTLAAMETAAQYYGADYSDLAYSVPATEHSVMTATGREGEQALVGRLIKQYQSGILSVVADSYDVYGFVDRIMAGFREQIMARDGVFVVRPDSVTPQDPTPELEMVTLAEKLWGVFGGTVNEAGYKVLDKHVRLLWGDGIDLLGIEGILVALETNGFAAENIACFGMGGGLLQKVNRDTQRCAIKACAQMRGGFWYDCFKEPLDKSKTSMHGLLGTYRNVDGSLYTAHRSSGQVDAMVTVFEDGVLRNESTFVEVRDRACQPASK